MEEVKFWIEVGKRIRTRRCALKITQENLANSLNVTRTAVTKIEQGKRNVSTLELTKIAGILCYPVWKFIPNKKGDKDNG